jgi:hypothetical protein
VIDDTDTVVRTPHSGNDPRVSVTISDRRYAWPIVIYFASLADDASVVGVEIGTRDQPWNALDVREAAHVGANLALFVRYARGVILWQGGEVARSLEVLGSAELGKTRRGLPGHFFRVVAGEYMRRVADGETAPVTSIAATYGVNKSTASRWVKEARRRGLVTDE